VGACTTNPIVNLLLGEPLASLYKSFVAFTSQNKLKPISMISHRPENAASSHFGSLWLSNWLSPAKPQSKLCRIGLTFSCLIYKPLCVLTSAGLDVILLMWSQSARKQVTNHICGVPLVLCLSHFYKVCY